MSEAKYQEFLEKYGANSERLHRIGIHSFGYNPGHQADIEGVYGSVSLPQKLVNIICDFIKKVYPETQDDKEMIKAYKKRIEAALAKVKKE